MTGRRRFVVYGLFALVLLLAAVAGKASYEWVQAQRTENADLECSVAGGVLAEDGTSCLSSNGTQVSYDESPSALEGVMVVTASFASPFGVGLGLLVVVWVAWKGARRRSSLPRPSQRESAL
jgi:hypothetical protein